MTVRLLDETNNVRKSRREMECQCRNCLLSWRNQSVVWRQHCALLPLGGSISCWNSFLMNCMLIVLTFLSTVCEIHLLEFVNLLCSHSVFSDDIKSGSQTALPVLRILCSYLRSSYVNGVWSWRTVGYYNNGVVQRLYNCRTVPESHPVILQNIGTIKQPTVDSTELRK